MKIIEEKNSEIFNSILFGYSDDIKHLFNKLYNILIKNVNVEIEEKIWAKMPSFYYNNRFVRFIPFKKHINIEAKAIKDNLQCLSNYKITPTGMIRIEVGQEIPETCLIKIFNETLLQTELLSLEDKLESEEYANWNLEDKKFIIKFNNKMNELGYTCNNEIVNGICYGKYMMIYYKQKVKSKKVYARIYFRNEGIVLRLFLNDISKHAEYINKCPDFIKEVFTGVYAKCNHCRGNDCRFRKCYNINNIAYEKCNGLTFEFFDLKIDYID